MRWLAETFDPSEDDRPLVMSTSDVGKVFLLPSLIQTVSAKAPRSAIRSVVSIVLIRRRPTGVGSELALANDMRFASCETDILSQWEVSAGLIPPYRHGRTQPLELVPEIWTEG